MTFVWHAKMHLSTNFGLIITNLEMDLAMNIVMWVEM
jgi:hypothetical protein